MIIIFHFGSDEIPKEFLSTDIWIEWMVRTKFDGQRVRLVCTFNRIRIVVHDGRISHIFPSVGRCAKVIQAFNCVCVNDLNFQARCMSIVCSIDCQFAICNSVKKSNAKHILLRHFWYCRIFLYKIHFPMVHGVGGVFTP